MLPHATASRSPRKANWRGMNSSWARIAASRGKALKLVFTARKRISAVEVWKSTKSAEPLPKMAPATWATIVGPPSVVGRIPKTSATTVMPMKSTPSRMATIVIVLAAFFASGGLKAGTPFAMASTP